MTKHIQVSTRRVCHIILTEFVGDKAHTGFRVCHTILTDYVGDKAHTDFYTPCLSYNTDRVCW